MRPAGFVYARLGQKKKTKKTSAINTNDDNDNDDR